MPEGPPAMRVGTDSAMLPACLRVAHVGRYRPDSLLGVDVAVAAMVEGLAEAGIGVEIWHLTDGVRAVRRQDWSWGPVFEVPAHGARLRGVMQLPRSSAAFLASRTRDVRVAHLHSVFVAANLQVARLRIPYVISPHGGYRREVLRGRNRLAKAAWRALLERRYLKRAAAIVVNSDEEARAMEGLADASRIRVIPNGVPEHLLEARVAPPGEGRIWLFLGRLDVRTKGLDLLLDAYAGLERQCEASLPDLVVAGPDHRGGRARLIRRAESLGIGGRVHFPGPVTGLEKRALMASSRLFVLLSRNEGMPLALLEALALGRPVVVTPGTGFGDIVAGRDAGWVAAPTVRSVTAVLNRAALAPEDLLDQMGKNARSLARSNFRWPMIVGRLAEVYAGFSPPGRSAP